MNPNPDSKPESKTEAKPESKTRAKSPTATKDAPILNPAWADEKVNARGINGPLAKAIAADLVKEVALLLSKSVDDEKINKLIRKSFCKHVGMPIHG
ncbi:MAG: hypothetical protein ABIT37_20155 [Luteolibacter sp.]